MQESNNPFVSFKFVSFEAVKFKSVEFRICEHRRGNSEITPFETTNNLFVSFEIESNNSALNEQLTVRKVSLEADLLKWRSAPDRNDRPV